MELLKQSIKNLSNVPVYWNRVMREQLVPIANPQFIFIKLSTKIIHLSYLFFIKNNII